MTVTTKTPSTRLTENRVGTILIGMAAGAALMAAILIALTNLGPSTAASPTSHTGIPPSFTVGYGEAFSNVRNNAVVPSSITGYHEAFAAQKSAESAPSTAGYQDAFSSLKSNTSAAWIDGYQDAFAAQEK